MGNTSRSSYSSNIIQILCGPSVCVCAFMLERLDSQTDFLAGGSKLSPSALVLHLPGKMDTAVGGGS